MSDPFGTPDDDPGWGGSAALIGLLAPPILFIRASAARDGLLTLRVIFLVFVQSNLVIGIVLLVMALTDSMPPGSVDAGPAVAAVALFGVLINVVAAVVGPRLDCTTPGRLVGSYRVRFFIRLALAEAPVLAAFVGAMVTGEPLVFLVGLPFGAFGYLRAAPTRRSIERDQDALITSGCGTSLIPALRGAAAR